MKTSKEFLDDYKVVNKLSRKERLYLEALVKAELKARRRAEKAAYMNVALEYMEARHEERLAIYHTLYGEE